MLYSYYSFFKSDNMRPILYLSIFVLSFLTSITAKADLSRIAKEYESGNIWKALDLSNHLKYKDVHIFLKSQKYLDKTDQTSFEEVANFITSHKNIAQKKSLILALENKLNDSVTKSSILKWFSHNKPVTSKGHLYYYKAALGKIKDKERMNDIIIKAWVHGDMNKKESDNFYSKYKSIIKEEDIADKISNLIWMNKTDEAQKYINLLGKNYQQVFKTAILILKKGKNIESEFHKIKGSYKYEPALLYAYLKLHKKDEPSDELIRLHMNVPKDTYHGKDWWKLQNYFIRELIERKNYKAAYKIATLHSNTEACDIVEAEWLAGWLALRFVHKPQEALKHFENIYNHSKSSISLARGAYWIGRTYDEFKKIDLAKKWYGIAAKYGFTYYGFLAQNELGLKQISIPPKPIITNEDKKHLQNNHFSQIAEFLSYTQKTELLNLYSKEAFYNAKTDGEVALLYSKISPQLNLSKKTEIAKLAQQAGTLLLDSAYPTPLKLKQGTKNPTLVYSIIRQESVFDQYAISSAKAMGLMQIIAPTAKSLCKDLKIKFDQKKLLASQEYNIMLGSHYLSNLLSDTNSYIRTAAFYNAGPASQKWVNLFGNPKNMKLWQVIDWIEQIPFGETRNYVQRVIENMQVYRVILTGNKKLNIKNDLLY